MKLLRALKNIIKHTKERGDRSARDNYYRLTWRNWFFLTGVLILTTLGLGTAIPPLVSERIVNPWPWVKTDLFLIVGLSITVFSVVLHLTQQQRRLLDVNLCMQTLVEESDRCMLRHVERIHALMRLGRTLAEETDLPTVFNRITNMCVEVFNSHRASLMLYEPDTKELVLKAVSGLAGEAVVDTRVPVGEGIAGWAAAHGTALLLGGKNDFDRYPELDMRDPTVSSAMVVPIVLRGELVGVINVTSTSREILYDREDLGALQVFAENTGAYIRHAQQAHWMRQTINKLRQSKKKETGQPDDTAAPLPCAHKEGMRSIAVNIERGPGCSAAKAGAQVAFCSETADGRRIAHGRNGT